MNVWILKKSFYLAKYIILENVMWYPPCFVSKWIKNKNLENAFSNLEIIVLRVYMYLVPNTIPIKVIF